MISRKMYLVSLAVIGITFLLCGYYGHSFLAKESYETKLIFLPLYGYDAYSFEEQYVCFIGIPKSLPLNEKLEMLALKVSQLCFRSSPIEILSITEQNGLRIARINLKEKENGHDWGWGYFQGSTGASITAKTLLSSFLQKEFTGEWIDGVEFTYEMKPISSTVWDHISLEGTYFRKGRE
jgi:hypothetical protein